MNRWSAPRGVTMYEHGDGEYYLASEVGDREAKHLARISELERATDIAIQLNNDHQQRISELETAIKELHEAGTAVANRRDELVARIAELEKQLAMANDAAAKGDLARQNAGGMEMRISELEEHVRLLRSQLHGIINLKDLVTPSQYNRICEVLRSSSKDWPTIDEEVT